MYNSLCVPLSTISSVFDDIGMDIEPLACQDRIQLSEYLKQLSFNVGII